MIKAHLNSFESIWSLGLIVFGAHLFMLGYLAIKSHYIPKIFGILLSLAGISYVFIHFSKLLGMNYANQLATIEMILGVPMALAEIGFAIWLLARGGKTKNETQFSLEEQVIKSRWTYFYSYHEFGIIDN